jgi:Family of unknown function (DUF6399)
VNKGLQTPTATGDDALGVVGEQGKRRGYGKPGRATRLGQVLVFGRDRARAASEVAAAQRLGVARTTLRSATERHVARSETEADRFFESPAGGAVMHRLVTALQGVLTLCNSCGVEQVGQVLRLSGLSRWVASSQGTQHGYHRAVVNAVRAFGREQTASLGEAMARKRITVALDEVFFDGHPVLVGLEAASGFLLVEKAVARRDEASWTEAMTEGLRGLNVEVVQGVGDEGGALGACVQTALGAHRSTDLFHGQYEVTRACSRALRAKQTQAEAAVESAAAATRKAIAAGPPRPVPAGVVDRAEAAYRRHDQAQQALAQAKAHRATLHDAVGALSTAYHPFDLATGAYRHADLVERELREAHRAAQTVRHAAALGFSAKDALEKAARLVPRMRATVAFFHKTVTTWVTEHVACVSRQTLLLAVLIPFFYLQKVAARTACRQLQTKVLVPIARLRAQLDDPAGLWAQLAAPERQRLQTLALTCADLFVRTSSAVEGRNGRLSLHHHALHRLRPDKLAALTVVHNFLLRRPDGTTAAERFFGQKPPDLFEHLVATLPMAGRPAARRRRPHRKELMMAA